MARRDEFDLATERATRRRNRVPSVITAHYDPKSGRIAVRLSNDLDVTFSPRSVQGLEKAKPSQLEPIEITPSGFGSSFSEAGCGHLPACLAGRCLRLQALDRCPTRRTWRKIQERGQSFSFPEQRPTRRQAEEDRRQPQNSGLTSPSLFPFNKLHESRHDLFPPTQTILRVTSITFASDSNHG